MQLHINIPYHQSLPDTKITTFKLCLKLHIHSVALKDQELLLKFFFFFCINTGSLIIDCQFKDAMISFSLYIELNSSEHVQNKNMYYKRISENKCGHVDSME